jgi:magnesium transporter
VEKYLYSHPEVSESDAKANTAKPKPSSESTLDPIDEKGDDTSIGSDDEKPSLSILKPQQRVKTAKFRVSPLPISIHIRRARRFIKSLFFKNSAVTGIGEPLMAQRISPATRTVYRMAKIRRLVTSLTRLLSTKADLIGQIRKRLATKAEWSLNSDPELYIHMGDILGQHCSYTNKRCSESWHSRPHLVSTTDSRSL